MGNLAEELKINPRLETDRIVAFLQRQVLRVMRRRGAVVGISGGIDSSVVLALLARAFDVQKIAALILPEKESDPASEDLARAVASHFGVEPILEDLTDALEGLGCYARRDAAIRRVFPAFDPQLGYRTRIVLPGDLLERGTLNVFSLVLVDPDGRENRKRLLPKELQEITAASNFKQRMRMAMLYHHAELRHFAVIGTANRDEHDLGFFVKYGDGGADLQPIAHLFKTQVYQMADYLGVPETIQRRTPSTDTYSGGGSQQEFFFRVPFDILDTVWLGLERAFSLEAIAEVLDLTPEQVGRVTADIHRKQKTTAYLRMPVAKLDAPTKARAEDD